ncbi:uncharacterized protein LOC135848336 [Planococcus citri]|uniref:uncharacterized protein LOC135848336 n=1 Tax=Planococcus citri TaxID=170843 RepID=UPI0031F7A52D
MHNSFKIENFSIIFSHFVSNDDLLNSITSENTQLLHFPINPNPPWLSFSPKIELTLTEKSQRHSANHIQNYNTLLAKYPDFVQIYTDGSKSADSAGCSVIHDDHAIPFSLPHHFSVLSTELYAIKLAIEYSQNLISNKILILSDSLSALHSIQNFRKKKQHPISQQVVQILHSSNKDIILCWIPSHSKIPQNEKADETAKLSLNMFPIPNIPIPLSDIKRNCKIFVHRSFQRSWDLVPSTNKLKPIKKTIDSWKTSFQTSRKDEVILFRLRTGHSLLSHGHILNKLPKPLCEICNIPVSINHLITECPKFQSERNRLIPNPTLESLLSDSNTQNLRLLTFLKEIDLYNKI